MTEILLSVYMVLTLLFPAFYSPYTDIYQSSYYVSVSWAYLILVVLMGVTIWRKEWKAGRNRLWIWGYLILLFLYNALSLYFNIRELHWYGEQFNNTIAFLFFAFLICVDMQWEGQKKDFIRFLLRCIVLSNVLSIVLYYMGYLQFMICNNKFLFFEMPQEFYERRHYWIYSHKSEYAVMILAFLALFICYRKKFKNKITFLLSTGVLMYCLYLANSLTAFGAAALIVAGALLDLIDWKKFRLNFTNSMFILWLLRMAGVLYPILLRKLHGLRDVASFGGRLYIWEAALGVIKKYPQGWGMRFGESLFEAGSLFVNNAHNIFLNAMLRFSVPVGICFTLLFSAIVIFSIVKGRNFLTLGMWGAILFMVNMDYSLMSTSMAMVFLIVYLVSVYKEKG